MANKRRDNFSKQTVEILAKRVTYCCSNPECRKATIGPNVNKNKTTTLNMSKVANSKMKQDVNKVSLKENEGISPESLGKIYVLAVMYIVFANTDSYTEELDKRIPFRNNILHNGIVMYSDEDVDIAYELLADLIGILVQVKERIYEE